MTPHRLCPPTGPSAGSSFLCALAVAPLLLFGCGGDDSGGAAAGGGMPQMPPAVVGVATPVERTVTNWDQYSGRLEAVESVEVRARVAGIVERVHFREGALVDKGDLLITLDPRTFRAERAEVAARRERARLELELAESELERIEPLVELRAVSAEELDQRRQRVAAQRAAIAALDAELDTASLGLDFARVRAPVAGRVGRAMVTEGNLVSGGTGEATVLTQIVSLDPVYLYFTPDERAALRALRRLRSTEATTGAEGGATTKGNVPVEMQLADEEGFPHTGYLDFVDNQLDPATGTLLLRAVFPNADGDLLPGLFATVRLRTEAPHAALLVPEQAIARDQTEEYVLVVGPDGQVERRRVETAQTLDGMRVVTTGLERSDRVVVEGIQKARPGMPVDARPMDELSDETADQPADGTSAETAPEAAP